MLKADTNAAKLSKEIIKFANDLENNILGSILRTSLDVIGNLAVRNHMIPTSNIMEAYTAAVDDEKTTIRTARLARSLLSQRVYSYVKLSAIPMRQMELILSNVKAKIPRESVEGVNEGIREVKVGGGKLSATIGSKTPYAATHEFGYKNIPARPSLQPAIEDSRDYILKLFDTGIKGEWDNRGGLSRKGERNV